VDIFITLLGRTNHFLVSFVPCITTFGHQGGHVTLTITGHTSQVAHSVGGKVLQRDARLDSLAGPAKLPGSVTETLDSETRTSSYYTFDGSLLLYYPRTSYGTFSLYLNMMHTSFDTSDLSPES